MIASLRGLVVSKDDSRAVVEAAGIGYEVYLTAAAASQLPPAGREVFLHIVESFGMYGGGETLYGFLTASEKEMFLTFKEGVASTGAKKALEYLDKASKSLPDFRRAILDKDDSMLSTVFGFSKKTAVRLIDALKDKLETVSVPGMEKLQRSGTTLAQSALSQALNALSALGYKPAEAKMALQSVAEETVGRGLEVEQILRLALKRL